MVTRPSEVKVRYLDRQGEAQEIQAGGLLATCLQHEIDHLNGVLFIDHISQLKRDRVLKKFAKAQKLGKALSRCASSSWARRISRWKRCKALIDAGP